MLRRECETDVLNKYVEINIFNTLEKEVSMRLLKKYFITTIILLFFDKYEHLYICRFFF